MTNRDHTVLACLLAIVGLYVVHLSTVEIQPWDEGLYAVRGEAIAVHGEWWDQTPHALGGLYSSTAPPMTSWGVALGIKLFGRTALGVRFFTLLCSALALWMMYLIGKRFLSYQGAILADCLLGSSLHWVIYARQAMTEVPLMAFVLVALWALEKGERAKGRNGEMAKGRNGWGMPWHARSVFIVAFGAALLTKMAVSFLPVLFVLPMLRRRDLRWTALVMVLGGIVIAAPWYATMMMRYGDDFWLAMTVPHIMTAVEQNVRAMGPLYYVNQLVVAHPMLVVAFIYAVVAVVKRDLLPAREQTDVWSVMMWFISGILVLSLAQTKNPHYVVILLPAAVFVAVYGLERIMSMAPRRLSKLTQSLIMIAVMFVTIPGLRETLKHPSLLVADPIALIIVGIWVVMIIGDLVLPSTIVDAWMIRQYRPLIYIVAGLMFLRVIEVVWTGHKDQIMGGREVSVALMERASVVKHFTYLYHQHNTGDAMNPQLAWYTAGWMNGGDPKYSYTPVHMPERTADLDAVASTAVSGSSWVVYYHPGIDEATELEVTAGLAALYDVAVNNEHYTLFQLR